MVVFSSDCFRLCWTLYFCVLWLFWPVISCVPVVSGFLLFRVIQSCFGLFQVIFVCSGCLQSI